MYIALYLLIAAALIIGIVALVVTRKYKRIVRAFPEGANVKSLHKQYPDLIAQLKKADSESDTEISLLNALRAINYPAGTLRVSWVRNNENSDTAMSIVEYQEPARTLHNSTLIRIHNDGGYGIKNDQHFFVLQHKVARYKDSHIELWFETDAPTNPAENLSTA